MGAQTVGLVAHAGAGKTSLAEALLHAAGAIPKRGSVDTGSSVMDFLPEAKEHRTTIQPGIAHFQTDGRNVDLLDTPGSMNFLGATVATLRAMDGVVMVASADPGLQAETEFLWEYLEARELPRLMVINQMDREQADFEARLATLNSQFDNRFVPVTLPMGTASDFSGVVDLIAQKAYAYNGDGAGKAQDIPAELSDAVQEARYRLVESAAEGDDTLLEKYLETESLTPEEVLQGLAAGTAGGRLVPVFATSALTGVGVDRVLEALVSLLPDFEARRAARAGTETVPAGYVPDAVDNNELAALVFSTRIDHYAGKLSIVKVLSGTLNAGDDLQNVVTDHAERPAHLFKLMGKDQQEVKSLSAGEVGALPKLANTHTGDTLSAPKHEVQFAPLDLPQPVLTYALELGAKGEEEKLSSALHRIMEEDPTLSFHHNAETRDFLVSGLGQIHLDLVLERLKREYHIDATYTAPQVPYRETIRTGSKAQGRHKKQSGGRGQYGDCWLELKPNGQNEGLEFHNAIVGGVIPKTYIPAVEKGVAEAMHKGVVAGFPVIGIDATVYDGSYHDVDSSEMAFKIAGSLAFKKAMENARPVLLEPVMKMEIVVAANYMGDVMGDINSRRGKVLGMDSRGRYQVVRAEVPMSEVLTYAIDLRAMTSGQGYFTQEFSHYEEVPAPLATKVMQARQEAAAH